MAERRREEASGSPGGARVRPRLGLNVDRSILLLALLAVLLAVASLLGQYLRLHLGYPTALGFIDLFDVAQEQSVPTWFTVSLLLTAAGALAVTSLAVRARGDLSSSRWWAGLAALFLLLSIDDAAAVHEMVARVLSRLNGGWEGYLMYPWVVVALPFAAVFGLIYLRFLWTLPARTRGLIISAAVLSVGGAVGFEMLGANHEWQLRGGADAMSPRSVRENPFSWQVLATVEELLEMLGILVLLYAVLDYLRREFAEVRVALTGRSRDPLMGDDG